MTMTEPPRGRWLIALTLAAMAALGLLAVCCGGWLLGWWWW
jgi:hypothetical protein